MDVDGDDKASVANSAVASEAQGGANASVMATPGTTVVGSTAGSIAPSDLDSNMMDVEEPGDAKDAAKPDEKKADAKEGDSKDKDVDMDKDKDKPAEGEEKKEEPTEEILHNPCRVLPAQKQFIEFPSEVDGQAARYVPLLGEKRRTGFLLLRDTKPEEPEDLFLEDEKKG